MGASSLHDPNYKHVCEALRSLREEAGLSQRALAEALGKNHTYVHKSEVGERKIDLVEWARWCKHCDADAVEAFAGVAASFSRLSR